MDRSGAEKIGAAPAWAWAGLAAANGDRVCPQSDNGHCPLQLYIAPALRCRLPSAAQHSPFPTCETIVISRTELPTDDPAKGHPYHNHHFAPTHLRRCECALCGLSARTPNTEREPCTLRVRPIMGRQSDHSVGSGSARRGLSRLTLRSRDCDQAGHTDIGEMTHTHGLVACRLISEGCRLARSKWHFPALVEQYRHDVPGRRPANGSSQPGPANTNAAGRRFRPLLSGRRASHR